MAADRTATQRKRRQRARDKSKGKKRVEFTVSPANAAKLRRIASKMS